MDSVPKDVRARWKSLDAFSYVGWCGSATLGGWLADRHGYTFTFLITAISQFVGGVVLYIPLLFIAPRFESEDAAEQNSEAESESESESESAS